MDFLKTQQTQDSPPQHSIHQQQEDFAASRSSQHYQHGMAHFHMPSVTLTAGIDSNFKIEMVYYFFAFQVFLSVIFKE